MDGISYLLQNPIFINKDNETKAKIRIIYEVLFFYDPNIQFQKAIEISLIGYKFIDNDILHVMKMGKLFLSLYNLGLQNSKHNNNNNDNTNDNKRCCINQTKLFQWNEILMFEETCEKSIQSWFNDINTYFNENGIVDDYIKITACKMKLGKNIRMFIDNMKRAPIDDYKRFCKILSLKFSDNNCKKNTEEVIKNFVINLEEDKIFDSIIEYTDLIASQSTLIGKDLFKYQIDSVMLKLINCRELWNKLLLFRRYDDIQELAREMMKSVKLINLNKNQKLKTSSYSSTNKEEDKNLSTTNDNKPCTNKDKSNISNLKLKRLSETNNLLKSKIIKITNFLTEDESFNEEIEDKLFESNYNNIDKKPLEKKQFYLPVTFSDGYCTVALYNNSMSISIIKLSRALKLGFEKNLSHSTVLSIYDSWKVYGEMTLQLSLPQNTLINGNFLIVDDNMFNDKIYSVILATNILVNSNGKI
uniref:MATH domain-containing protein n=1 Tax=Parastrongyloides trichosuri TaxID=131310 RepID=A0A0N4ZTY2_PARTI